MRRIRSHLEPSQRRRQGSRFLITLGPPGPRRQRSSPRHRPERATKTADIGTDRCCGTSTQRRHAPNRTSAAPTSPDSVEGRRYHRWPARTSTPAAATSAPDRLHPYGRPRHSRRCRSPPYQNLAASSTSSIAPEDDAERLRRVRRRSPMTPTMSQSIGFNSSRKGRFDCRCRGEHRQMRRRIPGHRDLRHARLLGATAAWWPRLRRAGTSRVDRNRDQRLGRCAPAAGGRGRATSAGVADVRSSSSATTSCRDSGAGRARRDRLTGRDC